MSPPARRSSRRINRASYRLFDLDGGAMSSKVSRSGSKLSQGAHSVSSQQQPVPGASMLSPEGGPYPMLDSKFDCCAHVIHCLKHDTVAVSTRPNVKAQWLPFTPIPPNKTWNESASIGALIVLSGGDKNRFMALRSSPPFAAPPHCLSVLRLELPCSSVGYITRLVFYTKLKNTTDSKGGGGSKGHSSTSTKSSCCADTDRLKWMSVKAVAGGEVSNSWGPELEYFTELIRHASEGPLPQKITEYSLSEALRYVPRNPPRNRQETILNSVNLTEQSVEQLYLDFVDHCFPSSYLSNKCFQHYMTKNGFVPHYVNPAALFRAFAEKNNDHLSFHEFLIGLALMEPGQKSEALRAGFVFRYYDHNGDHRLQRDEFAVMIADITHMDQAQAQKKADEQLVHLLGSGHSSISNEDFILAVQSGRFQYSTAKLCQAPRGTFAQVTRSIAERTLRAGIKMALTNVKFPATYKGVCQSCAKDNQFRLCSHAVVFKPDGRVVKSTQLIEAEDEPDEHHKSLYRRSLELTFNQEHVANVIMSLVRHFNPSKGTNKAPNGLMQGEHTGTLLKLVQSLHDQLVPLIVAEAPCARVRHTPAYIMGDIHGNLEDLLSLEQALWRRRPALPCHYVFLGDYVDRGRWSVECALYVMAFKLLCPDQVTLLRGNHEVRELQKHYTYYNECRAKYGSEGGERMFHLTNSIFDRLPVCAVVDGTMFCAHGGIPRSVETLDQLKMDRHSGVPDPQHTAPPLWEMLWSDPCHIGQFNDLADVTKHTTEEDIERGFIENAKRGTAYLFNEYAANHFLRHNRLSFIVRGHEVPPAGYTFHFGRRCITVFSCSHYCGNDNQCAVLQVHQGLMRVVRIDTTNNEPATD